ncbi:hypothetical protein CYLTODRAFT_221520 [Cylindrobasidium torrendii FP15055 ss-10]|uniref:Uncharacterized protein n=1 Tax=Cylindrobasidium torrendii FP15055 ss-10 TaxID=1314674 RepID=A0A0D7BJ42_9AGAR|nr:hypothetical protein CYLTODRAFT_221520 [Cylindrobasidium torrendii FP15055 ss-10]
MSPAYPPIPKFYKWKGKLVCGSLELDEVAVQDVKGGPSPCIALATALPSTQSTLAFSSFQTGTDVRARLVQAGVSKEKRYRIANIDSPTASPALLTLSRYMQKQGLVLIAPVTAEASDKVVAFFVVFPKTLSYMRSLVTISNSEIQTSIHLLLGLFEISEPVPIPSTVHTPAPLQFYNPFPSKSTDVNLQYALRILKLPKELHTFLASKPRSYCVWRDSTKNAHANGKKNIAVADMEFETRLLHEMLKNYEGENKGFYTDTEIVFVHVSALKTIHEIKSFAERMWKRVVGAFITYGRHASVPEEMWGFRSVFEKGGRVTCTPKAFLENPKALLTLLEDIGKHQHWSVNLQPEMLGALVRMFHQREDPLWMLEKGTFALACIFDLITKHNAKFENTPPVDNKTKSFRFFQGQLALAKGSCLDINPLVEEALQVYDAKYANMPNDKKYEAVVADIKKDMRSAQLHPVLGAQYRRFIVLASEEETKDLDSKDASNQPVSHPTYFVVYPHAIVS